MTDWCGAFTGETVAIIATGPSLTCRQVDTCRRAGFRMLAVNDAYRLAPDADALYACDARWWKHPRHDRPTRAFPGMKLTQARAIADARRDVDHVPLVTDRTVGLRADAPTINSGLHGGFQALNLALHLGARRVVLLGYDMKTAADGRRHFFGDHPPGLDVASPFGKWLGWYETAAAELPELGMTVVNATPDTALEAFPRAPLEACAAAWAAPAMAAANDG